MAYAGKVTVTWNGKTYEYKTVKSYQTEIQELLDGIFEIMREMQYEVRTWEAWNPGYQIRLDERDDRTTAFYIDELKNNFRVGLICKKDVLYFIDVGNQHRCRIDIRPHNERENDIGNLKTYADKAFEVLTLFDRLEVI